MSVERQAVLARMRSGDLTLSNAEVLEAFKIDPHFDPYSVPLEELDPAHPALFANDTLWAHFERLRAEDPVHYTAESMVGPTGR